MTHALRLLLFSALSSQAHSGASHSPNIQDETCLLQVGKGSVAVVDTSEVVAGNSAASIAESASVAIVEKADTASQRIGNEARQTDLGKHASLQLLAHTAALQTSAKVRQVPLGTNLKVPKVADEKAGDVSLGRTVLAHTPADQKASDNALNHTSLKLADTPLTQSGDSMEEISLGTNVRVQRPEDDKPWLQNPNQIAVSHPSLSHRDAYIVQTGSKVRPYRRQYSEESFKHESGAAQSGQSPTSQPLPRFSDHCTSLVILCALLDHENAFAVAFSTFIFVLLVIFWGASCLYCRGSLVPLPRDKNVDACGKDHPFSRQMSPEAYAADAFAREVSPGVTQPELQDAFANFRRQITPDAGAFVSFKKGLAEADNQQGFMSNNLRSYNRGLEAYSTFSRTITPDTGLEAYQAFKRGITPDAWTGTPAASSEEQHLRGPYSDNKHRQAYDGN